MSKLKEKDRCPNCRAWHGVPPLEHLQPGVLCGHDPNHACILCGESVGSLSMGGSNICSVCDCDPEHPMRVRFQRFIEDCNKE